MAKSIHSLLTLSIHKQFNILAMAFRKTLPYNFNIKAADYFLHVPP